MPELLSSQVAIKVLIGIPVVTGLSAKTKIWARIWQATFQLFFYKPIRPLVFPNL
jgi:hypothetical protein